MTRALLIIRTQADRDKAIRWIRGVPEGSRVEFKPPKRTLPQNDALYAALTDIATQTEYHGMKLPPNQWKLLFLDALKREIKALPSLDGTSFVNVGTSSSDLSVEEMTGLLSIIYAWGAERGIMFGGENAVTTRQ